MSEKEFIQKYLNDFSILLKPNEKIIEKIIKTKNILIEANKKKQKIMIFGNGGSAAMASHFSVDLTKNAKIRCFNFNESDLITCFSNDYGYEKWVEKAVSFYGDEGDVLIVISASGKSKNMIYGCEIAKQKKFSQIITFTGHDQNNSIANMGDINFWINSKAYNFIENIHQIWLLSIVDLIIGKREYPPN